MSAIHIILLSIGAALVCSMLRVHRPEIATIISLSVGIGALLLTSSSFSEVVDSIKRFMALANVQASDMQIILKASGLAILGELGVEICCDAGESALAGRIRLACRIAMLSMAMPFITQIVDIIALPEI